MKDTRRSTLQVINFNLSLANSKDIFSSEQLLSSLYLSFFRQVTFALTALSVCSTNTGYFWAVVHKKEDTYTSEYISIIYISEM